MRSLLVVLAAVIFVACGGSGGDPVPTAPAAVAPGSPDAPALSAQEAPPPAPASPSPSSSPSSSSADGAPTRVACTSSYGSTMTTDHGRLDGYLVAIVPAGTHQCNGDSQHLHLQIRTGGAIYDVAVNVDGLEAETDAPLPGAAWSEGWHPGDELDYVADLGLHAPAFSLSGISTVRQRVEAALASANHVAVFTTGYGPTGGHLVHRQGAGRDGAVVLDPLGPRPHVLAFRFDTQTF